MPDKTSRNLKIYGRVQGVWYREAMRREADIHGVAGWVMNCADGTVEAHVEGAPEAVDALVAWCRRGPPAARVSSVETVPSDFTHSQGFQVLLTK